MTKSQCLRKHFCWGSYKNHHLLCEETVELHMEKGKRRKESGRIGCVENDLGTQNKY